MSFKIIGDSCTDPVPGLKDAPEYAMVPLIIRIGNQEYVDNGMLTTEDLVARMAASPEGTGTACLLYTSSRSTRSAASHWFN